MLPAHSRRRVTRYDAVSIIIFTFSPHLPQKSLLFRLSAPKIFTFAAANAIKMIEYCVEVEHGDNG
jgi:hypothetical protein